MAGLGQGELEYDLLLVVAIVGSGLVGFALVVMVVVVCRYWGEGRPSNEGMILRPVLH